MAPLVLTTEQVRRNLELFPFQHGSSVAKADVTPPVSPSGDIGEAITRASAAGLPQRPSAPPSSVETFRNPKLHVHVLSTFLATSMQNVNYVPNASYDDEAVGAAQEAKGFVRLLSDLLRFGSYMPLVLSARRSFTYNKADCSALVKDIQLFVGESGIEPTIVSRMLIVGAASLTKKTEETPTMFIGYHFQGADTNPALYMFYGTAKMQRSETGKSVATVKQSIEVVFYKYEINSALVSSMAEALAITIVTVETLTEFVNRRFLLPSD